MRGPMIFFAILIGLLSLRFLSLGWQTITRFFTGQTIPPQAQRNLYRDLIMGVLLLILSIVMFI